MVQMSICYIKLTSTDVDDKNYFYEQVKGYKESALAKNDVGQVKDYVTLSVKSIKEKLQIENVQNR